METLGNKNQQKSATKFYCEICNYKTDRKCNFNDHLISMKHSKNVVLENLGNKNQQNQQKISEILKLTCNQCNKEFKTQSGLWKHKQKCTYEHETQPPITNKKKLTELDKDELIINLLKQNAELIKGQQDMMIKITENGINNTNTNTNNSHNTNTNNNSHNKAFNLNFFLNETCKNAMNITDFVDSIKLQLSDLMDVGELGYVEGISKIIVKNLNNLDETIRPIHCTDKKRETFYVKDQNQWEKDDNKIRLKKAVKKIADKNIRLLPQYRAKFPDYNDAQSIHSDEHSKIVIESMVCDIDKDDKIIKNISKVTTIREK